MKNLIIITLLAALSYLSADAQVKKVEYSPPFAEPQALDIDVLQLSNGNTFCVMEKETGIYTSLYNKERKIAGRRKINSETINRKTTAGGLVFSPIEIAGEPVLFIYVLIKKEPYLYRIRFDKDNGSLKEQQKIGTLPKYKRGAGYAMAFGGVGLPGFRIIKDPNSDSYVQLNYNTFAKETDKRIEAVYYDVKDDKHQVVSKAFYDVTDFKYVEPISYCVNGEDLYFASYAYNTKASGGEDSRIIISKLRRGESKFTHNKIEYTENFKDTYGQMLFNSKHGMLQLLTTTYLKAKKGKTLYNVIMHYIDPESLQIVKSNQLSTEGLEQAAAKLTKEKEFEGVPDRMVLLDDYSTTLLLEEETQITSSTPSGRYTKTETVYGKVGLINLDNTGKELSAYCMLKAQKGANRFFSYDFAHVGNKQFVIYNDNWENTEIKDISKYKSTGTISGSVAIYYQIENGKQERKFLFEPNNKDINTKFIAVGSGHFLNTNNTYAALMIDKKGKRKIAHIVWIEFE